MGGEGRELPGSLGQAQEGHAAAHIQMTHKDVFPPFEW